MTSPLNFAFAAAPCWLRLVVFLDIAIETSIEQIPKIIIGIKNHMLTLPI